MKKITLKEIRSAGWKTKPIGVVIINELAHYFIYILSKFRFFYWKYLPNTITILALISGILSGLLILFTDLIILPLVLYFFSWVLDSMDGIIARLTKNTSKLGAKLDYFGDIFRHWFILFMLWVKFNYNLSGILVLIYRVVVLKALSFLTPELKSRYALGYTPFEEYSFILIFSVILKDIVIPVLIFSTLLIISYVFKHLVKTKKVMLK